MQVINSYSGVHSMTLAEPVARRAEANREKIADGLGRLIADRAAGYEGPIHSTTGKMLWAIQAWYAELNDEAGAKKALTSHAVFGRQLH